MGRSAANRQGNVGEVHIIWRVVTLVKVEDQGHCVQ